jgi:hypothetical protein
LTPNEIIEDARNNAKRAFEKASSTAEKAIKVLKKVNAAAQRAVYAQQAGQSKLSVEKHAASAARACRQLEKMLSDVKRAATLAMQAAKAAQNAIPEHDEEMFDLMSEGIEAAKAFAREAGESRNHTIAAHDAAQRMLNIANEAVTRAAVVQGRRGLPVMRQAVERHVPQLVLGLPPTVAERLVLVLETLGAKQQAFCVKQTAAGFQQVPFPRNIHVGAQIKVFAPPPGAQPKPRAPTAVPADVLAAANMTVLLQLFKDLKPGHLWDVAFDVSTFACTNLYYAFIANTAANARAVPTQGRSNDDTFEKTKELISTMQTGRDAVWVLLEKQESPAFQDAFSLTDTEMNTAYVPRAMLLAKYAYPAHVPASASAAARAASTPPWRVYIDAVCAWKARGGVSFGHELYQAFESVHNARAVKAHRQLEVSMSAVLWAALRVYPKWGFHFGRSCDEDGEHGPISRDTIAAAKATEEKEQRKQVLTEDDFSATTNMKRALYGNGLYNYGWHKDASMCKVRDHTADDLRLIAEFLDAKTAGAGKKRKRNKTAAEGSPQTRLKGVETGAFTWSNLSEDDKALLFHYCIFKSNNHGANMISCPKRGPDGGPACALSDALLNDLRGIDGQHASSHQAKVKQSVAPPAPFADPAKASSLQAAEDAAQGDAAEGDVRKYDGGKAGKSAKRGDGEDDAPNLQTQLDEIKSGASALMQSLSSASVDDDEEDGDGDDDDDDDDDDSSSSSSSSRSRSSRSSPAAGLKRPHSRSAAAGRVHARSESRSSEIPRLSPSPLHSRRHTSPPRLSPSGGKGLAPTKRVRRSSPHRRSASKAHTKQ